MPEYLPSSRSATLTVAPVSSRLTKVEAPESARAGERITVRATVATNPDVDCILWAGVWDADTGEQVGYRMQYHKPVGVGEFTFEWELTMPSKDWRLEIRGGHRVLTEGIPGPFIEAEGSPKHVTVRLELIPPAPSMLPQLLTGVAPLFAAGAVVAYSEARKAGVRSDS